MQLPQIIQIAQKQTKALRETKQAFENLKEHLDRLSEIQVELDIKVSSHLVNKHFKTRECEMPCEEPCSAEIELERDRDYQAEIYSGLEVNNL